MALGANSYGTVAEVAALKGRYTSNGSFTTTTKPSTAQVEAWIDRVSAILNITLAKHGFAIPVSNDAAPDCFLALSLFVAAEVADLADHANSAGRFFTNQQYQSGPWKAISREAREFIEEEATGFEALGAVRTREGLNGLAFNSTNDAGDPIEPMFARNQFGNRNTDWDIANEA